MASMFDVANGVNIHEILTLYAGVHAKQVRGNISCPLHDDAKPSFHVYSKTNTYHCFSCKSSGTPINFVMALTGMTAEGAAKDICDRFGLAYDKPKPLDPDYKDYIEVYDYAAGFYNALLHHTDYHKHDYWAKRGLQDLTKDYKLGYCMSVLKHKSGKVMTFKEILVAKFPNIPEATLDSYGLYDKYGHSNMAGRFVIPIKDIKGNIVAFSGRSLDPNIAKYVNTPETKYFKKNQVLFNFDHAKKYPSVFVVEGFMDALSLIQNGINNVVATMGTAFTDAHLHMLNGKEIILALDNDDPGKRTMLQIIERYSDKPWRVFRWRKPYKDFNEALMDGVDLSKINERKHTVYGPEFAISYLKTVLDLSILYEREKLYDTVNRISKPYSRVAKDYFATILKRLLKGGRSDA